MLHETPALHWISLHGLLTMLALGVYLTASRIHRQRRHPSAAMAWLLSLALVPYLALPLYLVFGNRKIARGHNVVRTRPATTALSGVSTPAVRLQTLACAMGLPPASCYQHFHLHEDGARAKQALITLIDQATHTLDLCMFLVGKDVLGQEVSAHLIQKAHTGTKVRLLVDGVGFYLGGQPDLTSLAAAGVRVSRFVSPLQSARPGRTNLRNHRKMVIADGQRLWMGGRNLAAEYFEGDPTLARSKPAWTDLSFDFEGPIAAQAQRQFNQDWAFANGQASTTVQLPETPLATGQEMASTVQWLPSGPDQAEDTVYALLISGIFAAQKSILAVSPYFVPDSTLQMALTLAARRGVDVQLVLPCKSNHRLADMARLAALRELSASGARIWLVPEMIHAKCVVIDDGMALSGSANLDERSLFLNYEVMVAFYDPVDVAHFVRWLSRQCDRATLYQATTPGWLRELAEGAVRWLAFQL